MYIIKRKYIVKTLSLATGFILIIIGLILQISKTKIKAVKEKELQNYSIITNICASIENINSSFKKGDDLQDYKSQSESIYTNSKIIQTLLYLTDTTTENTIKWFEKLSEYSSTPMDNIENNEYYAEKINGAQTMLINICSDYNFDTCYNQIEDYFTEQKSQRYYNAALNQMEQEYSLLDNSIHAERKDITLFAKEVLGLTFSPAQFKGSNLFPKSISYSLNNSYANIFPSGKTLLSMSSFNSQNESSTTQNCDSQAIIFLNTYAPYANECNQIFKIVNQEIIYYIFCPVFEVNAHKIINYDESIKLGVSKCNSSLKAFDASVYLKNHPATKPNFLPEFKEETNSNENITVLSTNYVLHNNEYFFETKLITQNNVIYYSLSDSDNNIVYKNENEYLQYLGLK